MDLETVHISVVSYPDLSSIWQDYENFLSRVGLDIIFG